jgi:2-octaprenyl-6-methoxyphenol hydroxylase
MSSNSEILVAGTGPAGMICALAAAKAGIDVTLVGPAINTGDQRTTALMMPSLEFLGEMLDVDRLLRQAAPLKSMRIVDATSRLVRAPTVTFHANEIGQAAFGYNFPNVSLNTALENAVDGVKNIRHIEATVERWSLEPDKAIARLSNADDVTARLVVAADGRTSAARTAAGITCRTINYPQAALVLSFRHSRPHNFISTEFHTESGPFTQVPLPGNRSSLVWVLPPKDAKDALDLPDDELSHKIEVRMQSMLGTVAIETGRQVYPLSASTARRFAARRVMLAGEAAHVFPPIGAQGLNLGIRDAADLQKCIREMPGDPGSDTVLEKYHRMRWPDVAARTGAVDLLNRSLLSSLLPAQILRSAGLAALASFPPLRALAMREGMLPGSGIKSLFSGLREQIRR